MRVVTAEDISYYVQQSTGNLNMIISGMVALMNDTDSKVAAMESQGWFQRMVKTVSGKNKLTQNEIQQNNEKLNAYMAETIAELYRRDCVDHDIILSLGTQLNEIYADHVQLKQMLGAFVGKLNEKIDSVDNFHMLVTEIEQGLYSEDKHIVSICNVISQFDNRILNDSRKLDILRRSLGEQNILNDDAILLSDYLNDIINITMGGVGKIYLELETIQDNIIANTFIETIEAYHFLPDMNRKLKNKKVLVDEIIANRGFDDTVALSTNEIFDDFINSKINVKERLIPIEKVRESGELEKAEELFLDCEFDKAFELFKKLAEDGETRAMYFVGKYYVQQFGHVKRDEEKGVEWLEQGYKQGDVLASINYAYSLSDDDPRHESLFSENMDALIELAESGDVFAQSELADIYFGGHGTEKNIRETLKWLEISAEKGYWRSICELGNLYIEGVECDKDIDMGFECYLSAAKMGYPSAKCHLADLSYDIYNNGGDSEDLDTAIALYEEAYDLGSANAAYKLCIIYFMKDNRKSFEWARKAADLGSVEGLSYMGLLYYHGEGAPHDEKKGLKYLEEAAEKSDETAMLLGQIFFERKEYDKAIKYSVTYAEKGNESSQYLMGLMYANGNGVERNIEIAKSWMCKAAEQGNERAKEWLEENEASRSGRDMPFSAKIGCLCTVYEVTHDKTAYEEAYKLRNIFGLHHEEVYLEHDDTVFKSGKNGFAITEKGIYHRGMFESYTSFIPYEDLAKGKGLYEEGGNFYMDGERIAYMSSPVEDKEDFLQLLIDIVNTCKEYY